ncbi:MAG: IS21 family transposase [Acidobacteriota bacterium]
MRKKEKTLTMAAAKAGMTRNTARKYLKSGKLPSECRPDRIWRTRPDPYASVWPEVEGILERSPSVEATTVFDHLNRVHEGKFAEGQLRTLQRRIKQWRACHGELKEVMFPQDHEPGHQAQSDFTFMNSLGVTIAGQPFPHMLYHFVLTYSNWEATTLCFSESFESLTLGVQNAIWELGAVPTEHRTDRLSAAVNNLKKGAFTRRYQRLLDHYGMKWSRTQAGKGHENGDVEQSHHRLKRALEQELLLRGSRDFLERSDYEQFVQRIIERRNAGRQKRLQEELEAMAPLPDRRLEDFIRYRVKVSPSSTIRVRNNTYSVDSRLIREQIEVRMFADHMEVRYGGQRVAQIPRLRGEGKHRIDYRHVIHSLVRKPGAFARYRWREELFPGVLFRVAYDELREDCPGTADRQYLGILELAAKEGEQRVAQTLQSLIEGGQRVRLQDLKEALIEPVIEAWQVQVPEVDLQVYDRLLSSEEPEVRR